VSDSARGRKVQRALNPAQSLDGGGRVGGRQWRLCETSSELRGVAQSGLEETSFGGRLINSRALLGGRLGLDEEEIGDA
jgi:hypothetical protein